MGSALNHLGMLRTCLSERLRSGLPEVAGPLDDEVLFILDGVGGFQAAPLMVRRALHDAGVEIGTIIVDWQTAITAEIFADLTWLRRNRLQGRKLARRLLSFRRAHPETLIHILAYSGGAGIAVFACECLRGRRIVETLVLACPALSPGYNLGPALRSVKRGYALVSRRDSLVLGLGTRIFGTTDRRFSPAAGLVGFRIPANASGGDRRAYERFSEIEWSPSLRRYGHQGGHVGWGSVPLLRDHLVPILRGRPQLPARSIGASRGRTA